MPLGWAADSSVRKDAESAPPVVQGAAPQQPKSTATPTPDTSARKRVGKASFYAKQFSGKPMADGVPMDPEGDNAASRTLPLGTTAKVTNVETGKTAIVTIEDRGPYVDGRLVDLSPATAAKIGLTPRKGITKVVVAPIAVPLPDGKVKVGAAASEPADEPDPIPVHEEKPARGEKLAQGEKPVHAEKPAHGDKAAADQETKLAAAAAAGNQNK
jgi:peptidoglycan lytic transglycosylase